MVKHTRSIATPQLKYFDAAASSFDLGFSTLAHLERTLRATFLPAPDYHRIFRLTQQACSFQRFWRDFTARRESTSWSKLTRYIPAGRG
jgi:hypothetical protein